MVEEISKTVEQWKAFGRLAEVRQIASPGVTCGWKPTRSRPATSLCWWWTCRRSTPSTSAQLDEFNTVLQHLVHQQSIAAIVVTGARSAFVAGADVKELLEVG